MNDPIYPGVSQPAMPRYPVIGNAGTLQQWFESSFDPTSGYTTRAEYRALDWNRSQTLANYFTNLGISVTLKNEHGLSTLTLTDATGNYVIDKWELSVDVEQPEMFENPLFLSLMNGAQFPSLAISMMRQALKGSNPIDFNVTTDSGWFALVRLLTPSYSVDPSDGSVTTNAPITNVNAAKFINALGIGFTGALPADGSGSWTSDNMVLLKQYFDSFQLGTTNFLRGKYKLRHTSNIPARWDVSVADFNVECIYTIPQLLAECTGSEFIYPLPNYLSYKISNFIPEPIAAWTPWYMWGALKEKSDAQTAVNNRVEITTIYLIDNISTLLYSPI